MWTDFLKDWKTKLLGWPKCPFSFFYKIKDTFFIFTNNFVDLDILSMSPLSPTWHNIDCSQLVYQFDCYNCYWCIWSWSIVQKEISITKLNIPPLTHLINHSTFSVYCTHLFLHFSCIFTFLEMKKHNMTKMHIFFHLQY